MALHHMQEPPYVRVICLKDGGAGQSLRDQKYGPPMSLRCRARVSRGERLLCDLLPAFTEDDPVKMRRVAEIRGRL